MEKPPRIYINFYLIGLAWALYMLACSVYLIAAGVDQRSPVGVGSGLGYGIVSILFIKAILPGIFMKMFIVDGELKPPPVPRPVFKPIIYIPRPRDGYVYLIRSDTGCYKIGCARNPEDRLRTFEVKLPFRVEYLVLIKTNDMRRLEGQLHAKFTDKRISGEWFNLSDDDVQYIKSLGRAA